MAIELKPAHFQTIHYYFFSLGVISLTSAFLMLSFDVISYIFIAFYIINSVISWQISVYLHTRSKDVFIIKTKKYIINHMVLIFWSAALSVFLWYLFHEVHGAVINSLISINFFIIFLTFFWYVIGKMGISKKYFSFKNKMALDSAKKIVENFNKKENIKLRGEDVIKSYEWGSSYKIDELFHKAKKIEKSGSHFEMMAVVRDIIIAIYEKRIFDLEEKIEEIGKVEINDAEKELMKSYQKLILDYRKELINFEKVYKSK